MNITFVFIYINNFFKATANVFTLNIFSTEIKP